MSYSVFLIRLFIALFLSILVGVERQWRKRSAGLRTNVLVCIGAFLFACIPLIAGEKDGLRMAAQVISGIGFLGAGVVIKDGANIRGLNTAATLWCNAAVGVLCALGMIFQAVTGTILLLLVNIGVRYITRRFEKISDFHKSENLVLKVILKKSKESVLRAMIIQSIGQTHLKINCLETIEDDDRIQFLITLTLDEVYLDDLDQIVARFSMDGDIYYIGYTDYSDDN